MIFLVQGTVHQRKHEQHETISYSVIRIVQAPDEQEARYKFKNHFQDKSSDYDTYYSCDVDDVSGVLE